MVECDNCASDVREVWRHRRHSETMTHREIEWICTDCHPELPVAAESPPRSDKAIADGGRPAGACPICSGATVGDRRSSSCTECGWTGSL